MVKTLIYAGLVLKYLLQTLVYSLIPTYVHNMLQCKLYVTEWFNFIFSLIFLSKITKIELQLQIKIVRVLHSKQNSESVLIFLSVDACSEEVVFAFKFILIHVYWWIFMFFILFFLINTSLSLNKKGIIQ